MLDQNRKKWKCLFWLFSCLIKKGGFASAQWEVLCARFFSWSFSLFHDLKFWICCELLIIKIIMRKFKLYNINNRIFEFGVFNECEIIISFSRRTIVHKTSKQPRQSYEFSRKTFWQQYGPHRSFAPLGFHKTPKQWQLFCYHPQFLSFCCLRSATFSFAIR